MLRAQSKNDGDHAVIVERTAEPGPRALNIQRACVLKDQGLRDFGFMGSIFLGLETSRG